MLQQRMGPSILFGRPQWRKSWVAPSGAESWLAPSGSGQIVGGLLCLPGFSGDHHPPGFDSLPSVQAREGDGLHVPRLPAVKLPIIAGRSIPAIWVVESHHG